MKSAGPQRTTVLPPCELGGGLRGWRGPLPTRPMERASDPAALHRIVCLDRADADELATVDRIAVVVNQLVRAAAYPIGTPPPPIKFTLAKSDGCNASAIKSFLWTPATFDESGYLFQVSSHLTEAFELFAAVDPEAGAAALPIELRVLIDHGGCAGDEYVWTGEHVAVV